MTQPAASSATSGASGTGTTPSRGGRETFAADELAIVLSHFDVGVIDSIAEFPRGSRKAPKLLIATDHGKFLLKRRARGKDDPYKVAFCHALQLHLAGQQFPLPHLIGTRRDNNSMLQWRGAVYEMFEYIAGQNYPQTLESTFDSGRILGLYHKLLDGFETQWQPATGSYHKVSSVEQALRSIGNSRSRGPGMPDLSGLMGSLVEHYRRAAQKVEELGIAGWPSQIVHADWHPGNMLFRDNHVVAVIDYDSARSLPRVIDVANGALQFSIIGGDDDVSKWPDRPDENRFKRFIRGYDEAQLLSDGEVHATPWLMIEALIAEAVFPIAVTGTFSRIDGVSFLQMVDRKVSWIARHASRLVGLAAS